MKNEEWLTPWRRLWGRCGFFLLFLLVVLVWLVGVGGHEFFEGSFELLGDGVHVMA